MTRRPPRQRADHGGRDNHERRPDRLAEALRGLGLGGPGLGHSPRVPEQPEPNIANTDTSTSPGSNPGPPSGGDATALLAQRLDALEHDVREVRTRINALFFAVLAAAVGDLAGRLVLG